MKTALPLLFCLFATSTFAAESTLQMTPNPISAGQDQGVLFTVVCSDSFENNCPDHFDLIEWDKKNPDKIKSRMQLLDSGLYGDVKAGDHIYSRQVWFIEYNPATLHFSIGENGPKQTLEVKPRLSFLEMLEKIWANLKFTTAR